MDAAVVLQRAGAREKLSSRLIQWALVASAR
jgi:hypothetical protein